ncbi:putative sugar phosphate transporter domain-containing protein [Helianthus anomalus]
MSKLAVSFTHIIKSGEPAFNVLVSRFILGDSMYSRLCVHRDYATEVDSLVVYLDFDEN